MNSLNIQNPDGTIQVNGNTNFILKVIKALSDAGILIEENKSEMPVARTSPIQSNKLFRLEYKQADSNGYYNGGSFVIKLGSTFSSVETASIPQNIKKIRQQLKNDGRLVQHNIGTLRLTQDYAFSSPSAAACAVTGSSRNGWRDWLDSENGQPLEKFYK